eukprot:586662-Hanusia_phi.AAC.1
MEGLVKEVALDNMLTENIHNFKAIKPLNVYKEFEGGASSEAAKIMGYKAMKDYIERYYKRFKYDKVEFKNQCGGNATAINFNPTQDFVRHFFTPESEYKGLLLYHSVGTGKTCSAIAVASTAFEKEDYTILWVCNVAIQEKMKYENLVVPSRMAAAKKHLSENWMDPISYKQFSNMLLKKNKIYDEMVKRNGEADPLKKTLLIIDEAHKIYGSNTPANEKPNREILEQVIDNSYRISGKDSVKILAMTGTPYTQDAMEMIQNIYQKMAQ